VIYLVESEAIAELSVQIRTVVTSDPTLCAVQPSGLSSTARVFFAPQQSVHLSSSLKRVLLFLLTFVSPPSGPSLARIAFFVQQVLVHPFSC